MGWNINLIFGYIRMVKKGTLNLLLRMGGGVVWGGKGREGR